MLNISSHFNKRQLDILEEIGILFDDEKDYSVDELLDIQERITDAYLDNCFDKNGDPLDLAKDYESIIDLFCDEFNV